MNRRFATALLTGLALSVSLGCGSVDRSAAHAADVEMDSANRETALLPIRNARIPLERVLSGGQPTPEQIEMAARAGYRTVINLRTEGEPGYEWERDAVERLGMRYVQIPVGGGDTMTPETIARIDSALNDARAEGPVIFHCASGNRIGAVLALRAAWHEGVEPDEAHAFGMRSGMTRLTDTVRELLNGTANDDAK